MEGCVTTGNPCLGRPHNSKAGNKTVAWQSSLSCWRQRLTTSDPVGKYDFTVCVVIALDHLWPWRPENRLGCTRCPWGYCSCQWAQQGADVQAATPAATSVAIGLNQLLCRTFHSLSGHWNYNWGLSSFPLSKWGNVFWTGNEILSTNGRTVKDTDHLCYHRRPIWNTFCYWKLFQHQRRDERNSWRNEKKHVFSEQFCVFLHVQYHVLAGVHSLRVMASRLLVGERISTRL